MTDRWNCLHFMKARNKLLSLATAFVMTATVLLSNIPVLRTEALEGAKRYDVAVNGVLLRECMYLDEEGNFSTGKPSGGYLYICDSTLTMHDYEFSDITNSQYFIKVSRSLEIVLEGTNTIEMLGYIDGVATLFGIRKDLNISSDERSVDLTFSGDGTLNLTADHGIGADVMNINGPTINITASDRGISAAQLTFSDANLNIVSGGEGIYVGDYGFKMKSGNIDVTAQTVGLLIYGNLAFEGGNTIVRTEDLNGASWHCAISQSDMTYLSNMVVSVSTTPYGKTMLYDDTTDIRDYALVVVKETNWASEILFDNMSPDTSGLTKPENSSTDLGTMSLGADETDITFYGYPKALSDDAVSAGASVSRAIKVYRNDSEFYSYTYQDDEMFGWNLKDNITDGGEYRIELSITGTDGEATMTKTHTYTVYVIGSTIDYLEAIDLETPVIGQEPDYTVTCDIPGVYVQDVVWNYYDEKWEWLVMDDGAVFETGQRYEVTIVFCTEDGFSFTETADGMTAYINDVKATVVRKPYATNKANVDLEITPLEMGDINADGNFNVADVVALQKWLVCAKGAEKSIVEWKAGNFVDDDRLDALDLSLMKRALLNS